jgi:hypothetical protein
MFLGSHGTAYWPCYKQLSITEVRWQREVGHEWPHTPESQTVRKFQRAEGKKKKKTENSSAQPLSPPSSWKPFFSATKKPAQFPVPISDLSLSLLMAPSSWAGIEVLLWGLAL